MADDDPSGIATYSQGGAQFGYALAWSTLLTWPLMMAIQLASARIGRVTGQGLVGNLSQLWPRWAVWFMVGMLAVANLINLGADLSAMADVTTLLLPGMPKTGWAVLYAGGSLLCTVLLPYRRYVTVLKWLAMSTLAYAGVALAAHVDWPHALLALVWPEIVWQKAYATTLVAILGTTLSPYLFFWQAEQEVEEIRRIPLRQPLLKRPEQAESGLRRIRLDTLVGMGSSNLISYFMIVAAAATLHAHGITHIETTAQAAQALQPFAGEMAFVLFACGVLGTGLLALPVLAGSLAYAVASLVGVRQGLDQPAGRAKSFYGVLSLAMFGGCLLSAVAMAPIDALYWAAVVNAVIAVPIMAAVLRMASDRQLMRGLVLSPAWCFLGWLATLAMGLAALVMGLSAVW